MKTINYNSIIGYNNSALGYLQDTFPELFSNGDIYSRYEDGGRYWYFNEHAVSRISQWTSNMAATGVIQTVPQPYLPNNGLTKTTFIDFADKFIKSLMPGSSIRSEFRPNAPYASANYSSNCK